MIHSSDIDVFDEWNEEKKFLHLSLIKKPRFHEREIWWCSIGKNLGDEQDGKNAFFERPVLILKKFNDYIAWVLPLSSKLKIGPYYYAILLNKQYRSIILSQLRLVSVKRFRRIMIKIPSAQFRLIRAKIKNLL